MSCNPCNKSILSQTPSKIGETQCTQPCPEEITCEDIIPSNCVFYSGSQLICPSGTTSVDYGDTITEALGKMYELICQNSTSNTVQVTANDTCYGYLASKIISNSLTITVSNPGACEKLSIEQKCKTWTELTKANSGLASTWTSAFALGFEKPAFSNANDCIVRLAGTVFRQTITSFGDILIGTLPLGKRPNKTRRFTVNFTTSLPYPLNIIPSFITILTNGEMYLNNPYTFGVISNATVSLDGISFETGTII